MGQFKYVADTEQTRNIGKWYFWSHREFPDT